jgi:hypothetical protein
VAMESVHVRSAISHDSLPAQREENGSEG